jgi:hypothetical protein
VDSGAGAGAGNYSEHGTATIRWIVAQSLLGNARDYDFAGAAWESPALQAAEFSNTGASVGFESAVLSSN